MRGKFGIERGQLACRQYVAHVAIVVKFVRRLVQRIDQAEREGQGYIENEKDD